MTINSSELNILLIPTFLQGMNNSQICAFIKACTKKSKIFKQQIVNFSNKLSLAKKYTAERKCYCPTKIEWDVITKPLIVDHLTMTKYYNFIFCDNTGFAYIFRKTMECIKNQQICRQFVQDGKSCCE